MAEDGITRTWTFNQQNLLEVETHPESGSTTYIYNAAGVLATKLPPNGTTTNYDLYDGNDRLRQMTAVAPGGPVTTITYEGGSDNIETMTNWWAGVVWRYDTAGRVRLRQDTIDGKLFTTEFEYDMNDNVTAILYPSGRLVEYDVPLGQPTKVYELETGRDYAAAIMYHASGGLKSYVANNGTITSIGYHPQRYWINSVASGPLQLTYDNYDGVGNPRAIGDSRPEGSQTSTYTYDDLDRLTHAITPQGVTSYAYDVHGNRNDPTYQYQEQPRTLRLTNQNGTAFTYDNNGNTITAGGTTYTYTPQNLLETVSGGAGVIASYAYNANDQRVRRTAGGSTTYYIRGLNGELLTEWKDPGTAAGRIRDYMYLGTRLLSAATRNSTSNPPGVNVPRTTSHRFATSWQVPAGSGDSVNSYGGITAAARKSSHPDMPRTGVRIGVQGANTIDDIFMGPMFGSGGPESPKQGGLFVEFEVERYPFSSDAEWLAIDGGGALSSSTDDLRLYITSTGTLVLKHDGARATPLTLWTSSAIGLHTRHTLELRFEYNAYSGPYNSPNPLWENQTSWAKVYFDGAPVATYGAAEGSTWDNSEASPLGMDITNGATMFIRAKLKSPGPANGLLMNLSRVGATAAKNHGDALDVYGDTWRTTLLEAAGAGTHSQWTGGQPDWRARSAMAGANSPLMNGVTTNVTGHKISYRMESMVSRGVTGSIGTVLVGVRMNQVSANTRVFIRRNGVETILSDLVPVAGWFRWYRVAESGWSATDTIEIGVTCGDNSQNGLAAVALIVEHNTPEPAPLTDTALRVVTVSYTGNGSAQTIDFGANLSPTVLFVLPATGSYPVEPMWWWDSRLGAASFSESIANFTRIWPQKGKFHVVHATSGDSYNANGVNYIAIALFDPAGRYVIPFAVSKPLAEDNYTHALRYPQSGALASDFTPDFLFGGAAFSQTNDSVRASLFRGPGHVGDLTAKLGTTQASDADRIQAMGAGTVEFGTTVSPGYGDQAFWAGRVSDGVAATRLMAVTSYVGDGTTSRNITLDLSGASPTFVLVVPTNATAKIYRVSTDTTGRSTSTGNAIANAITALGVDQITVGTALNATGVTYDVWAITAGMVP